MNQYSEKERALYKNFVDVVARGDNHDYHRMFNAWYDLYNTNNTLALKALFHLCSKECPFRNNYLFSKILNKLSENDPEECKAIINSGLIEKYANTSSLIDLLGHDDDDVDRCVINHLAGLIIKEALENVDLGISELYGVKHYIRRISNNENATRYFEKYYGIKPELWLAKTIEKDCKKSKYDLSALDKYDINLLPNNDAE